MKSKKRVDVATAKPVHPRNIRQHGLLGLSFVTQHWFIDDLWTPVSITEEFSKVTNLLRKRLQFATLENEASRRSTLKQFRKLKRHCRFGRKIWQHLIEDSSHMEVRKALANHKGMQRLYRRMSIYQVVDNINQRTFVMRKERDRLFARQEQLKKLYAEKILLRGDLETRIKYQNEFILDEEVKIPQMEKLLVNSNTRLAAIKTINSTYKKMVQILNHDAIFYEPILSSLDQDIKDQGNFIKYILSLGAPAIVRFKELSEDYRMKEDRAHKQSQIINNMINSMLTANKRVSDNVKTSTKDTKRQRPELHFVRETPTMLKLKHKLENIEAVIKTIKGATFCSTTKEVYSRIRYQVDSNYHLRKIIENDDLGYEALESKTKWSSVLREVLMNNLAEEEMRRVKHIGALKRDIKHEDEVQEHILEYLKHRAEAFVLLRYSLWNIHDIMRHVAPVRARNAAYETSYLKLPLLKFEILTVRSVPPEPYEENVNTLMRIAEKKLKILTDAYSDLEATHVKANRSIYENEYIASMEPTGQINENEGNVKAQIIENTEYFENSSKAMSSVPTRKQIKANSYKIMEESLKMNE